jgi:predicted Zn finger-like uncharacterized protein
LILRCPGCGAREPVSGLRGDWWATCGTCGQVLRILGPPGEAASDPLKCPRCGYREEDVSLPLAGMSVNCPSCRHRWRVST